MRFQAFQVPPFTEPCIDDTSHQQEYQHIPCGNFRAQMFHFHDRIFDLGVMLHFITILLKCSPPTSLGQRAAVVCAVCRTPISRLAWEFLSSIRRLQLWRLSTRSRPGNRVNGSNGSCRGRHPTQAGNCVRWQAPRACFADGCGYLCPSGSGCRNDR